MKKLSSNKELYEYLVFLASELKKRGATELSEIAAKASRQGYGMSTEFLGESRIALQRILEEENGILDATERTYMQDVLTQIGAAFDRRSGR